ncbi:MAG: hypothetical protein HQ483_15110 [Rhodospirillales bacterium]|nr:hypothetical protein [Rhodospirillales bacterium]
MVTIRHFPRFFLLIAAVFGFGAAGHAEQPLGSFGDWDTFTEREGKNLICYMASEATKARGDYTKRGRTYIMVTHRPAEKSSNVVSVEAGYAYKTDSEVEIDIGKDNFKLFTAGSTAFAYDSKADDTLIKAMIRGAGMTVKGLSQRDTLTTDTYSLKGFTAAYKAISAACKV